MLLLALALVLGYGAHRDTAMGSNADVVDGPRVDKFH